MRQYLRILAFGKSYYPQGILAFFFLILYNIFSLVSLTMVIPFLEIIFKQDSAPAVLPDDAGMKDWLYYQMSVWIHSFETPLGALWGFCLLLGAAITLKNLFRYLSGYYIAPLEQGVIYNMRERLFGHLSILSMPFFTGHRKGSIINVLVTDVQIVQESVIGTVQNVISDPLTMITYLSAMIFISWKLTLFSLLILPPTAFFLNLIAKSLKRKARRGQERMDGLISVLDEFIGGIRIVKAFGSEDYEKQRYEELNDDYRHQMVSMKRRSMLASPMTETVSVFVLTGLILFGGNMILSGQGEMEPSSFIYFIVLFTSFLMPIKTFSAAIARIQKGLVSFSRITGFLDAKEEVQERPDAEPVNGLESGLRYENLRFRYGDADVLSGVDIEVNKGETIALVGPSGGGKSTLADLLPRFYDPVEGRITWDGRDIRDLRVRDLRGLIGMVTQEGTLFNDTVLQNIAYGDPNPDRKRVEAVARAANAHGFIAEMEKGYDTVIGERGSRLSGGQRQRIAIARALYKNAPVLVLDEATSALDSESERLVQEALDKLMEGRTSIVIAHRLSTIRNADRIYVIDKGRIVESGTHEQLLGLQGLYKSLYDIQFREDQD